MTRGGEDNEMRNFNKIKLEDRTMTKLNDAQLNQVAGGTSQIEPAPSTRSQRAGSNPVVTINYGSLWFADDPQFGVS